MRPTSRSARDGHVPELALCRGGFVVVSDPIVVRPSDVDKRSRPRARPYGPCRWSRESASAACPACARAQISSAACQRARTVEFVPAAVAEREVVGHGQSPDHGSRSQCGMAGPRSGGRASAGPARRVLRGRPRRAVARRPPPGRVGPRRSRGCERRRVPGAGRRPRRVGGGAAAVPPLRRSPPAASRQPSSASPAAAAASIRISRSARFKAAHRTRAAWPRARTPRRSLAGRRGRRGASRASPAQASAPAIGAAVVGRPRVARPARARPSAVGFGREGAAARRMRAFHVTRGRTRGRLRSAARYVNGDARSTKNSARAACSASIAPTGAASGGRPA
jgi:hypothetical protein